MRFKEFITEGQKFNLEKFKSDCAFTLDQLGENIGSRLMYRGQMNPGDEWSIDTWKGRTAPRNTHRAVHDSLNVYFEKKFGAPIRNWMFASGNRESAQTYAGRGFPDVIFPIGKFEWVSTPDPDLYDLTIAVNHQQYLVKRADVDNKLTLDESYELATNALIKQMDKAKWFHNSNLLDTILSEGEIMFKCNKYYKFSIVGDTWNSKEMQDFIHNR